MRKALLLVSRPRKSIDYLHPAALSLRAYILPMSPMPMRPTVKSSIQGGTAEDVLAMVQELRNGVAISLPKITSCGRTRCKQNDHRTASSSDALPGKVKGGKW